MEERVEKSGKYFLLSTIHPALIDASAIRLFVSTATTYLRTTMTIKAVIIAIL